MACILGHGSSGVVSVYESDTNLVLKGYEVWHNGHCEMRFEPTEDGRAALEIEDTIYQRLGSHPHILKCYRREMIAKDKFSLVLERAKGDLRSLMLKYTAPAEQTRLRIAMQISCGIAYMHSKNVFHCDISCRNVFVFGEDWQVKIGDFGGSKIDNQDPLGAEEVRYELPLRGRAWGARGYLKRELFALGCAIYEVMEWKVPFAEITNKQTEENYANEVFPDTDGLLVGDIIRACWEERFETAEDVEVALREKLEKLPSWVHSLRSWVYSLRGLVYSLWSAQ